ncbi:MAG: hypothetical protein H7248_07030 [Microbacteriaceae bacterium]|nr:hypothetical protein [Microbacteriaceae bacterium]
MYENFSGMHVVVLLAVMALVVGIVAAAIATVKDSSMLAGGKIIWLAAFVFLPVAGIAAWGLSRVVLRRKNARKHEIR